MTHKTCHPFMHALCNSGLARTASGSAATASPGPPLPAGSSQIIRTKVPACRKRSRNRATERAQVREALGVCVRIGEQMQFDRSQRGGHAGQSTAPREDVKANRAKRHNQRSDGPTVLLHPEGFSYSNNSPGVTRRAAQSRSSVSAWISRKRSCCIDSRHRRNTRRTRQTAREASRSPTCQDVVIA